MTVARRFFGDLLTPDQDSLLAEADRRQIERFAKAIDLEIDQKIKDFETNLNERVSALADRDFVEEFTKAVEQDRLAIDEKLKEVKDKLKDAEGLAKELKDMQVGDDTKAAAERVETSLNKLRSDLDNAEQKIATFANGLGRTGGATLRRLVTGGL